LYIITNPTNFKLMAVFSVNKPPPARKSQCKGFLNNLVLILARTEREQNEAKKHFEHKKAPFCFLNRPTTNCELNVKKR